MCVDAFLIFVVLYSKRLPLNRLVYCRLQFDRYIAEEWMAAQECPPPPVLGPVLVLLPPPRDTSYKVQGTPQPHTPHSQPHNNSQQRAIRLDGSQFRLRRLYVGASPYLIAIVTVDSKLDKNRLTINHQIQVFYRWTLGAVMNF